MTTWEAPILVQSYSRDKVLAMARALPARQVYPIPPLYDETSLKSSVPLDNDRHVKIATEKDKETLQVLQSIGGAIGGIIISVGHHAQAGRTVSEEVGHGFVLDTSDTVRLLPNQNVCLEKPATSAEWMEQVLMQRGQPIAIASHHVLRKSVDAQQAPVTLTVVSELQVRDFTQAEIEQHVIDFTRTHLARETETQAPAQAESDKAVLARGISFMRQFAGSLPIDHMKYFFEPSPIHVQTQVVNGFVAEGSFEVPDWQQLTREELIPIFTGAFTPPMSEAVYQLEAH